MAARPHEHRDRARALGPRFAPRRRTTAAASARRSGHRSRVGEGSSRRSCGCATRNATSARAALDTRGRTLPNTSFTHATIAARERKLRASSSMPTGMPATRPAACAATKMRTSALRNR